MKKNMPWYLVPLVIAIIALLIAGFFLIGQDGQLDPRQVTTGGPINNSGQSSGVKLLIPALLEDKNPAPGKAEFDLVVQYGRKEFVPGSAADTLGYNGDYLGPVIKVTKGDDVQINVNNTLDEPTTVHWHGLEVAGEMDGGPHNVISPKSVWQPHFIIDQPAATLWYHPHLLNKTGEQVYKGLAGLIYIEDENSLNLEIPKDYGVNDIPLIIQDKRFTQNGGIPYDLTMNDLMTGFFGNTVIVNGGINPGLDVKNEIIRLRILNGSNARTYDLNFSGNQKFYQIASDGGFLKESVTLNSLVIAPAERAEILVDLSGYKIGDQLILRESANQLMRITISQEISKFGSIPKKLVQFTDYNKSNVLHSRLFIMSGMGPMVAINGKQMDMNVIDETIQLDELEEWVIRNDSSGMGMGMMGNSSPHPFHVHGVQFQIIERNGQPPPLNERGWKDTVLVEAGGSVRILVTFKNKGMYMYHCHILEHEDLGMMGQIMVE